MKNKLLFAYLLMIMFVFAGRSLPAVNIDDNISKAKKEVQDNNKSLDQIKNKIKEKSVYSEKLKGQEVDITTELKRINRELGKIQAEISRLNKKIVRAQIQINMIQVKIVEKREAADQTRKLLSRHLRVLYKYQQSTLGYLPAVLANVPYDRLVKSEKYLKTITQENWQLFQQLKEQEAEISAIKKELEVQERQLEKLQTEVKGQEEVALKQKNLKNELLAKVKGQRKSTDDEIAQLKKEANDLQNLVDKFRSKISKLEKEKIKQRQRLLAAKKGSYDWPVKGTVVSNFGKQKHSTLNTYVVNNGIEIKADEGTAVSAIEQGKILYAGAFKGYGQMVIIDHGDDFYTVYAHLSKVLLKEGDSVAKGQPIGETGYGKNSRNDSANVYFEVRQDGKPEDPLLWLK
ncbi:MAG: peptidoglycan DD-metalloendopeptidase family protein [bacterium]|nr:peptidoglycan DD-metalloendopeptidase family protein [bacterium]